MQYTQTSTFFFEIIYWLINFPVRLKMAVNNCFVRKVPFSEGDNCDAKTLPMKTEPTLTQFEKEQHEWTQRVINAHVPIGYDSNCSVISLHV
jgi:hypothetical protein